MKLTAPKQRQGEYFEQLACEFLQQQGLVLVCQNWHYKNMGELDLVMIDNQKQYPKQPDCLVIVEVRQRKTGQFGTADDSITKTKQKKLIKTTQAFLQCFPQYQDFDVRFDVVSFDGVNDGNMGEKALLLPSWLKSAFIVGE